MQTIYEQIGGAKTVDKLIGSFYRRVLADPMLSPFFENTSIETLERMQKAFFTIALGGPDPDVKISIYETHRGRGIKREHLTRFTEHLMTTLREVGVDEENAKKVYQRISIYADDVLGEASEDG
jgi:hemoglobin